MITSDKSHSSFVTIAKKVSESIVMSSYEQNKKQSKKRRIVLWQIICMDKCAVCVVLVHLKLSVMLEKSCLLPNIEALYINSPVPPCDCRKKCKPTTPLLVYVFTTENICKKGHDQCIFANSIA